MYHPPVLFYLAKFTFKVTHCFYSLCQDSTGLTQNQYLAQQNHWCPAIHRNGRTSGLPPAKLKEAKLSIKYTMEENFPQRSEQEY